MSKTTPSSRASQKTRRSTKKTSQKQSIKTSPPKKTLAQKSQVRHSIASVWNSFVGWLRVRFGLAGRRRAMYLLRRPHRSFQMTRRRDYARSLKIPGYFSFTIEVWQVLWKRKWTFILLGITFAALVIAFGMLGSQETYRQVRELVDAVSPDGAFSGAAGEVSKAGLVLLNISMSIVSGDVQEWQRLTMTFFALYVWLVVVWLLRNSMAGKRIKLRDGLYSAGAPILPTFLVGVIMLIQLIPMAIAIIVASTAWQTGFIQEGAASMAAGLGLALVGIASLYWIVSTFFALIIVTLPGMYPFRAIAIAGDLVVGRRLRLMYRLIWLALSIVSWWVVIMIPVILLDTFIKSKFELVSGAPIVPVAMLVMTTFTIVWAAAYVYLLYRKVVDDDAGPA